MCLRVCLRKLSPNAEIIAQDIDQSKRHVLELKSSLLGKQASRFLLIQFAAGAAAAMKSVVSGWQTMLCPFLSFKIRRPFYFKDPAFRTYLSTFPNIHFGVLVSPNRGKHPVKNPRGGVKQESRSKNRA